MKAARDFSVYPVWITGAPRFEYAKVRAAEGALGLGRPAFVLRAGETIWRHAHVVQPAGGFPGFCLGLALDIDATPQGSA